MIIRFSPEVALHLETIIVQARGRQVSGVGYVNWDPTTHEFQVYKTVLLYLGNEEANHIPSDRVRWILSRSKDANALRFWWHTHDFGDGYPDAENWSRSDELICRKHPLGLRPEELGWSVSAVRTPLGWVGRYDIYGAKGNTYHIQVLPNYALQVEERFQEIIASQTPISVSQSTLRENYDLSNLFEYEAFSEDYEEMRKLVKPRENYYGYGLYDAANFERNNYDDPDPYDFGNDEDDDSFEQFVFMGGLDPNNW